MAPEAWAEALERVRHDVRPWDACTVILMYFRKQSTVYWLQILRCLFLIYVSDDVRCVILMYSDRCILQPITALLGFPIGSPLACRGARAHLDVFAEEALRIPDRPAHLHEPGPIAAKPRFGAPREAYSQEPRRIGCGQQSFRLGRVGLGVHLRVSVAINVDTR